MTSPTAEQMTELRAKEGTNMALTYTPPAPLTKPFKTGEVVEVCDRDLSVMSEEKIARAGKKVIHLVGGRTFRASDGWWIGSERAWPFPSIRHKEQGIEKATAD
jgi:hypothetical protein